MNFPLEFLKPHFEIFEGGLVFFLLPQELPDTSGMLIDFLSQFVALVFKVLHAAFEVVDTGSRRVGVGLVQAGIIIEVGVVLVLITVFFDC